jgi:hypothetical protein
MEYSKRCDQAEEENNKRVREKHKDDPAWHSGFRTIDEICHWPLPQHGDTWGNWKYNAKTLALTYVPRNYDFDIEDSQQVGAKIFHVCAKTWMTAEDKGNLITALSDLIYGCWASDSIREQGLQNLRNSRRRKKAA